MAINSIFHGGQNQDQASCTMNSQDEAPSHRKLKSLISSLSANSNCRRRKSKNSNKSVYLSNDNVHLRSLAEENYDTNFQTSFQLAAKLYKSNSDEFKLKKKAGKRSNKKSVLTLPNQPSTLPQSCTVSDMNDTEYLKRINKPKSPKTKKRLSTQKKRHHPPNYEYYDRDADYCSQMNVYLDCSSVDVVKNFKGDCRRKTRASNSKNGEESSPSDVWTVLRNINRFQFHPSPPMSDERTFDELMPRKKKIHKNKLNRGVYETCRTEQIAYFSNIEVNIPGVGSPSDGSSQITVIDNQTGFDNISKELEKTFHMLPLKHLKNDSAKPTKSKANSKRSKNSNITQGTNMVKKNSASKDTLLGLKSEMSLIKLVETTNKHDKSILEARRENVCTEVEVQTEKDFEQARRENVCTEVEVQTEKDFEQKEVNTSTVSPHSRTNNADTRTGTMSRATINENILRHPDKAPTQLSGPPPYRPPWRNAQVGPNKPPERLLMTTPKAVACQALTTTPVKAEGSTVRRMLSMAPSKAGANSMGRPLTTAPLKTVACSTGRPLFIAPTNTIASPAVHPLSSVASKSAISPPSRPMTTPPCKTIANPPLIFSKLQDCPRLPQITAPRIQPFTQAAIRRIIAKLKFPLVILGRDQVSGTFEVAEYDYPQFRGLDEQVWPYMIDWTDKPSKPHKFKAITPTEVNPSKRNKMEQMRKTNAQSKQSAVAKVKPTSQFRDNMLKLLYKKASHQNIPKDNSPTYVQGELKAVKPAQMRSANTNTKSFKTVDASTSGISIAPPSVVNPPKTRTQKSPPLPLPPTSPSKILIPPKFRETKPIWGRAKWASEFIENIIKKIKNGTFYSTQIQCNNTKAPLENRTSDTDDLNGVNDSKEVSIQVSMPLVSEDFTPKITIQKKKELSIMLPGFDVVMPQLEIKSMTRNQIAVKHCVTNVILQFDVNMPPEADRTLAFKRSTSCVPLSVTESKTKVFKCKTRIVNAVLPAELCSIIPKVMMQFLDREIPLTLTSQEEKRNTSLSTISENTTSEILEPFRLPLLPQIEMFPELRRLRNGRFSKNPKSCTDQYSSNENFYIISVNELSYLYGRTEGPMLLRPLIDQKYYFVTRPGLTLVLHSTEPKLTSLPVPLIQNSPPVTNLCTALVPYTGNKMVFGDCTNKIQNAPVLAFKEFFGTMLKANTNCMFEYFPTIQLQTCNNQVYVKFSMENHQGISTSLCINATNLILEPLYNATDSTNSSSFRAIENNGCPEKQIEYIKRVRTRESNRTETKKPLFTGVICKARRGHGRYVKLYKKCKSMSHIASEMSSTPLSKVTNLDEFFQALGAGKMLSSAVEGSCGSKILSCISDLKSYITGITPRQALLVMLLANKKDTSNLVRFRPIILQGIAVNRITRVSELDMEVEVIEKERFKMPEYLDMPPPILEITQNNDILLEELYWIAKTTASDYQTRFDESSEKLLKALLEKRKRLNPSYLRVMARYVGLGLLKTPTKH